MAQSVTAHKPAASNQAQPSPFRKGGTKSGTAPVFDGLDTAKKKRIVENTVSQWKQKSKRSIEIEAALHILHEQEQLLSSDGGSLVSISSGIFQESPDIFRIHEFGLPVLHVVILTQLAHVVKLFRHLLQDNGFSPSVAGLADMELALQANMHEPSVFEQMAKVKFLWCFGSGQGLSKEEVDTYSVLWSSLLLNRAPPIFSAQTYLQHLAMQPLQRRVASFPRTLAFVESLLQNTIKYLHMTMQQALKKERSQAPSRGRVVWIIGTDVIEGQLARDGAFEDAGVFKDEPMTVYLISPVEGAQFTGEWPCGQSVTVHAISDYSLLAGIPPPVLVIFPNTGVGMLDDGLLDRYVRFLVFPYLFIPPPVPLCILTSRCEAEVRGERALLEFMKALPGWPRETGTVQRDFHVRNLYSGMAGSPDVDYDDHGWVAAIVGFEQPREVLEHWHRDPRSLIDEFRKKIDNQDVTAKGTTPGGNEEALAQTEGDWRVLYKHLLVREEPSVSSKMLGVHKQGDIVRGRQVNINGTPWLETKHTTAGVALEQNAWMLIDGQCVGLGQLLERVSSAAQSSSKSPAVFWGILDLKYDSDTHLADLVKVLETGDGKSSKFSGYGAAIKETFQQDHKLEETIRRAVITENKKLTHDVIVQTGYAHTRPRQLAFPKVYNPGLAASIQRSLSLADKDVCVLKLCNRARGAGVIPVVMDKLDQALQELLQPPANLRTWFKQQSPRWAREVSWGCFEEQLRHWWSNECPCFVVEELCKSMPTERDTELFDGTMRVGFSLHVEHRDKLPPGWVESSQGPVRIGHDGTEDLEETRPMPWDDKRPFMDLFRADVRHMRVQWLGGYWKLPVESINSDDLRGKIVSVAKKGTAPVPAHQLHQVYAALGDMVSGLFGFYDISPQSLKKRYATFPELGAFMTARLACSMRAKDQRKSLHVLQLAQAQLASLDGKSKDLVNSYIHRNLGVAEAGAGQWALSDKHFYNSLEAMPTNATTRFLLGMYQLEMGNPQAAIGFFEEALLLDPDFKASYVNLGVAYLREARYEKAADTSAAGLIRHPGVPALQYNLGISTFCLAYLKEQGSPGTLETSKRAEALEALEAARSNRPKDNTWTGIDTVVVSKLRSTNAPLQWPSNPLPKDGWRFFHWRP